MAANVIKREMSPKTKAHIEYLLSRLGTGTRKEVDEPEDDQTDLTIDDEIAELRERNEMLEECLIELANILYA